MDLETYNGGVKNFLSKCTKYTGQLNMKAEKEFLKRANANTQ